jgi:cobalt/nickel transport system permease protein
MCKVQKNIPSFSRNNTIGESFASALDPRGKILISMIFIICVISYSKYELLQLIPYFSFPIFIVLVSNINLFDLLKKIIPAALFAIVLAAANPFLDTNIVTFANIQISAGWISFLSIILRFLLTTSAAFLLVMTTEWFHLNNAMHKLGIPKIFINQMLFMERFIQELLHEAKTISQARASRSFDTNGYELKIYGHILSTLLNRSFDKALRIYNAMLARGYTGDIPVSTKLEWTTKDTIHLISWIICFSIIRLQLFKYLFTLNIT